MNNSRVCLRSYTG